MTPARNLAWTKSSRKNETTKQLWKREPHDTTQGERTVDGRGRDDVEELLFSDQALQTYAEGVTAELEGQEHLLELLDEMKEIGVAPSAVTKP